MRKVGAAQATRLPRSRESLATRGAVNLPLDKLTPTYSRVDVRTVVGDSEQEWQLMTKSMR